LNPPSCLLIITLFIHRLLSPTHTSTYTRTPVFLTTDLHNETINIHTHLLGALVPLFLLLSHHTDLFMPHYPSLTPIDLLHCTVFLMSAVVCLSCSAMYHTLSCHSQRVAKGWNQMDYVSLLSKVPLPCLCLSLPSL
jgi:predicted membrane channel-forming protein YqfA (hemolysin III family)